MLRLNHVGINLDSKKSLASRRNAAMLKVFRSAPSIGLMIGALTPALAQDETVVKTELRRPMQGGSLALGAVAGVAYYREDAGGKRVVLTLAPEGGGLPMRFEMVLASRQSALISVPGTVGGKTKAVQLTNQGDLVSLSVLNAEKAKVAQGAL
jgi:hypothetical protein